jgi:hypothetical protein
MGRLAEGILRLVRDERYVVGQHASERLDERGIMEWQAVEATLSGHAISEHPDAEPNPSAEFVGLLPDGTEVKVVWSYLRRSDAAKLVTVHFLDEAL